MADVKITCTGCGAEITVSDVVEKVLCRTCGAEIVRDASGSGPRAAGGAEAPGATRKFRFRERDAGPSHFAPPPPDEVARKRRRRKMRRSAPESWRRHQVWSWTTFVLLGSAMWVVRYAGILPPLGMDILLRFGPLVVLGFHILVVFKAFEDSVFSGIFSLLIPPYAYYYLFFLSDDFYLRAVLAGLLVGLGVDSALAYWGVMMDTYNMVNDWIQTGGGNVEWSV